MSADATPRHDPIDDANHDADPPMRHGVAPEGWRLPGQVSLGPVTLQVSDLARSVEYYMLVLGLALTARAEDSADLGTVDGRTTLVRLRERKGGRSAADGALLGLYHFAILLPSRVALGQFVTHVSELHIRVGAADHLVSEALYLRDVDGLGIEVYADRPRDEWKSVDRQIQMASNPLDFKDLMRGARGTEWQGMPAGTRMGHVHLHVVDLARASDFYHMALGLDKMVWSYPGALFLAAGGYHHHLGLNTWAGADAVSPTERHAKLLEWMMCLESIDAVTRAAASIVEAGFRATENGADWIAEDPWGTQLRISNAHAAG